MQASYKKTFFGLLLVIGYLLFVNVAFASPEFMVSWKAGNYAPAWYKGKIFPTNDSRVNISFEVIDNGKIIDVNKQPVRWYVDGRLIKNEKNGLGIKNINFFVPQTAGGNTEIKISLPQYKGGEISKVINIPSFEPELVIESGLIDNQIKKGVSRLIAWPFFFNTANIANLDPVWSVNGQRVAGQSGNSFLLDLNVTSNSTPGAQVVLDAEIKNLRNAKEIAEKTFTLVVK